MTPEMTRIANRINQHRDQIAKLEQRFAELRREEIKKVEVRENISSVTLLFNGRVINSRKNRNWGYRVTEGGKILMSDYRGNLKDLRFDLATGRI